MLKVLPDDERMMQAIGLAPEFAAMLREKSPGLSVYGVWLVMEDEQWMHTEITQRMGGFLLGEYRTAFLMSLARHYFHDVPLPKSGKAS